ncbi:MAG: hypothetical protein WA393_03130 [Nitrososphaeraceae archaeon]
MTPSSRDTRQYGKFWIWISNELIEIEIKIKDEYGKLIPELSEGEYNELKQ